MAQWLWRPASPQLQCESAKSHPGELMVQVKSESSLLGIPSCCGGADLFVLFRPSTNWVRPTCIVQGNVCTQSSLTWVLISSKSPLLSWHIKLTIADLDRLTSISVSMSAYIDTLIHLLLSYSHQTDLSPNHSPNNSVWLGTCYWTSKGSLSSLIQ